ncbi:hypothetical protein CHS0354_021710 [Potamilus streckersoni]|uniref:Actin-modulator n=1 Tax=Potamilus streckersoni TaxID=2493646 RepID=A0AAE0TL99_9BIVA|nr:hypothetical protein CHS0354_021710 [Potamilus streckersoni]
MSGLVKAKKYDWKDTNMALFGSDTDKKVKKESAETEPMWHGVGKQVGLKIWRIVKFKVTEWPKEDYGKFYNGDSYIVLNTYKEKDKDELEYDVHFWIGQYSTQDEYGTAAYKTVELDTFLNDKPIQHREVEGYESELFKSYFKTLTVMNGGAESGFKHVEPREYQPRLMWFASKGKRVELKEVALKKSSVTSDDVYILDLGLTIIQFNGSKSSGIERAKAAQEVQRLQSERGGKPQTPVIDEGQGSTKQFFDHLLEGGKDAESEHHESADPTPHLYRISDADGSLDFEDVKKGKVTKKDFDSNDVFVYDTKKALFVWIGKQASIDERRNAMGYAHKYLQSTDHPYISVTCLSEGKKCQDFEVALSA